MQQTDQPYYWRFNKIKASVITTLACLSMLMAFVFSPPEAKAQCPISASFSYSTDSSGYVYFTNTTSVPDTGWYWYFDDGDYSYEENPYHYFATDGAHAVTFMTNAPGYACDDSYTDTVYSYGASSSCTFEAYFTSTYDTLGNVSFTDLSNEADTAWDWTFDDGTHSYEQNPTHYFATDGYHYISFSAYNSDMSCWDSHSSEYVYSYGATSSCTFEVSSYGSGDSLGNIYFTSFSNEADTNWYWDFGDGEYSYEENPVHYYSTDGYHTVTFSAWNSDYSCYDEYVDVWIYSEGATVDSCDITASFTYQADQSGNIYFYDLSYGSDSVTSWTWYFDDGTMSSDQNPMHAFATDGYHHIHVSVYNSDYSCQDTYHDYYVYSYGAQSNCNVYAGFGSSPDSLGNTISFYDYSSGDVATYYWDFGDGTYSTDANPVHTYSTAGEFYVYQYVYDSTGTCSNYTYAYIYVACNADITAYFTYSADSSGNVNFTDGSYGADVYNYYWSFDDYTSSYEQNPMHTFSSGYHYTTLYVYDASWNCYGEYSETVYVPGTEASCYADFAYSVDSNDVAMFTDASLGDIYYYYWDFGNGGYSYDQNPSYTLSPGYNYVALTVYNADYTCSSYDYEYIYVEGAASSCLADFTYQTDSNGTTNFTNTSMGDVAYYYWYFDDGTYAYDANPSHTFTSSGYHYVSLNVYDSSYTCSAYDYDYVYIQGNGAACLAKYSYLVDSMGMANFSDKSQGDIGYWYWDFGDGSYSYDQNPSHQYATSGYYYVYLYTYDYNTYCSSDYGDYVYVSAGGGAVCQADYSYFSDSTGMAYFDDKSLGNVGYWYWDFGDGNYSYDQSPNHQYAYSGYYYVYLYTYDYNTYCSSDHGDYVYISAGGGAVCQADFGAMVDSTGTAYFDDKSLGNVGYWYWDFGDGSYSYDQSPSHQYAYAGYYYVYLYTYDYNTGCSSDKGDYVYVGVGGGSACQADFGAMVDSSGTAYFDDKSLGNVGYWYWDFGDGSYSYDQSPSHQYAYAGYYYVYLYTYDYNTGCSSDKGDYVYVGVGGGSACQADFGAMVDSTGTAYFDDKSLGSVSYWYWDFGDGGYSYDQSPSHQYTYGGYFYVSLYTYDYNTGCSGWHGDYVYVAGSSYSCQASFGAMVDSTGTAYFDDKSLGSVNYWYWDFGDGGYSYDQNPTHQYTYGGYFYVSLYTYDYNTGCSGWHGDYVYVAGSSYSCQALFSSMTDSTGTAYFKDQSLGNVGYWYWDFGDGSYSFDQTPSHQYAYGGYYYVSLYTYDYNTGCSGWYGDYVYVPGSTYSCQALFSSMSDSTGTAYFKDQSLGSVGYWYWDFGDGSYSFDQTPSHQYAYGGYYYVSLYTYDYNTGCSGWYGDYVYVPGSTYSCQALFSYMSDSTGTAYFKDQSLGNVGYWYWDFGDGSYSFDQTPSHQYAYGGYYYVYLYTYDYNTGCSGWYGDYVYISGSTYSCQALFSSMTDSTGTAYFKDQSLGNVGYWYWDFGDGNYSFDSNPIHQYNYGGYYYVYLYTYDYNTGCQGYYGDYVYVAGSTYSCQAHFSSFIDSTGTAYFKDQSKGNVGYWYWDFGDGYYSFDQNPTHQYMYGGYYYVYLYTYDYNTGCQGYYGDYVYVAGSTYSCQANFSSFIDSTGTAYFKDQSLGTVGYWYWDFGDGSYSNDQNPTHKYSYGGYYYVYLYTYDYNTGCQGWHGDYVYVTGSTYSCAADFSYFTDSTGMAYFKDLSLGNVGYWYWYFDDGGYSYDQNPTHQFAYGGYHYVYLYTYDYNTGCSGYDYDYVYVPGSTYTCAADFSYFADTTGAVYFKDLSLGNVTYWYWYFDDGYYSFDQNPNHTFASGGYHYVYLSTYDGNTGCTSYDYDYVYVPSSVACNASFGYYADQSTKTVYFNDNSLGNIGSWYWYFDDGYYSYDQNPTHQFATDGYHYVYLSVYDYNTACQSYTYDYVYIPGNSVACNALFGAYVDSNDSVFFTDKSQGTFTDYYWDFGDAWYSNSNLQNPTFHYDAAGSYYVCLSVYDANSGCQASYCDFVTIVDTSTNSTFCAAEYSYYPDSATNTVYYTDKSVGGVDSWYWNFGDNTNASSDQNPIHQYADNGYYKACETVWTNNGCQETYCDVVAVGDVTYSCYAEFSYYANKVTSTAHFKNLSKGNITSYYWDFGDGYSSVQKDPSHTYADTGYYAVCLTIYSDSCTQSFCDIIRVGNALANPCQFSCVWPGDANDDLEANHYDLLSIGLNYGYSGPHRDSVSIMWMGHYAEDWATWQSNGANNRHADCNGDGLVDLTDVDAIDSNFAYSHPAQMKFQSGNDLHYEVLTTNIVPGGTVEIAIMAGDSSNITMYGVGWELGVDPTVVVMSSVQVNFANTWLGTPGGDLLTYDETNTATGQVYMSSVRNDHTMKTNQGEIARVSFTISSSANGEDLSLELTTFGGINSSGDTVPFVSSGGDSVVVTGIAYDATMEAREISVYPNPTNNGNIAFSLPTISNDAFEIKVYNNLSQVVYSEINTAGGLVKLDLGSLSGGMYSLSINSERNGRFYQRFDMIK